MNAELRYLRDVTLLASGFIAFAVLAGLVAASTGHFNAVTFAIAFIVLAALCSMAWAMLYLSRFRPRDPSAEPAAKKPKARYLPAILGPLTVASLAYFVITDLIALHAGRHVDRKLLSVDICLLVFWGSQSVPNLWPRLSALADKFTVSEWKADPLTAEGRQLGLVRLGLLALAFVAWVGLRSFAGSIPAGLECFAGFALLLLLTERSINFRRRRRLRS